MLILEDLSGEVPYTNAHYWDLKEFSQRSDEAVLMYGYNASANESFHKECQNFKRKIFFNNWAPCEFAQYKDHNNKTALEYEENFNEVYSICPYSCDWLNSLNLGRKYKSIFYPYNAKLIPESFEKEYDVIYHGGIHGLEHFYCLQAMKEFNYRYVTMTHHINELTRRCLPFATNVDLSFQEKINLVAKSKISICYNLVHLEPQHAAAIKTHTRWQQNEAFSEVDKWNVMPQFKTRVHEGAISKTLNLVQKDRWNIIEKYYEPDKEFIYFNDENDLRNKIKEIINDWDSYQEVVENAHQKALQYTTNKFIELIRNDNRRPYEM